MALAPLKMTTRVLQPNRFDDTAYLITGLHAGCHGHDCFEKNAFTLRIHVVYFLATALNVAIWALCFSMLPLDFEPKASSLKVY